MSRTFFATGLACGLALVASVAAQEPQTPKPSLPSDSPQSATVSMQGCLMRELDVPGRQPPDQVRSETNTDDDYILIDAKPASAASTGTTPTPAPQPGTPIGTSGSVTSSPIKFKVKGLELSDLAEHKNQRVQIEGALDRTDRDNNPSTFAGDLVILRATAIRKIEGECPSKSSDK